MTRLVIIADDLSGALECASLVGPRAVITRGDVPEGTGPVIVDTDSRSLPAAEAAQRVARACAQSAQRGPVLLFKKVDSLLRGNTAAELAALPADHGVILAPSLPALGRTVEHGALLSHGAPFASTPAWEREAAQGLVAPSVLAQLLPSGAGTLSLPDVASPEGARVALGSALVEHRHVAADAAEPAHLFHLASAALERSEPPVLAGSAALLEQLLSALASRPDLGSAVGWAPHAAATSGHRPDGGGTPSRDRGFLGSPERPLEGPGVPAQERSLGSNSADRSSGGELPRPATLPHEFGTSIAVLVGTPEPASHRQVRALLNDVPHGAAMLNPATPETGLEALSEAGDVVLYVDPTARVSDGPAAARALATAARDVLRSRHLVLTGGETAGAVLRELGITELYAPNSVADADGEPVPGLALSTAPTGQLIITKPGSYGQEDTLLNAVRALKTMTTEQPGQPSHTP